ncbi:MAG: adenylyl-sulfate kinase, partial [Actinomycetota bacterium]
TGAASAEAAVLVIDADEGVQEQSRRHGYLLHLLGLGQIAVAVNKMDLVGFDEGRFRQVEAEIVAYLNSVGVTPTHVIPVAARSGDNVKDRSDAMAWYQGPTVLGALDGFAASRPATDLALRLPVQDVYKFDARRIIAGRIESGRLRVGDTLVFAPSGKTARVATIENWAGDSLTAVAASAGQSIGLTLDEQIFVERGQVASLAEAAPTLSHTLKARLFWLGKAPLAVGARLKLKLATAEHAVEVAAIERVIDVADLANHEGAEVARNAVAEVVLRSKSLMAFDAFTANPRLGRFVLVEGFDIVGGGVVAEAEAARTGAKATNIFAVDHKVTPESRALANGHGGGVVWLTGLSGAGKSTIAMEVERQLFLKGWQVAVLDGDNVRHGLCSDLGFSPEDRAENIRRVGEVAHLLAKAGMLVVTAFISPYRADRDKVRAIGPDDFHEVFVATGLDECERRDPKGLYAKARAGKIPEFTGISAPYEAPDSPEKVLNTEGRSIDASVADLIAHIEASFGLAGNRQAAG